MPPAVQLSDYRERRRGACFTRAELARILSAYSQGVAQGRFRDYAIQQGGPVAGFFFFRHAAERPLFTLAKSIQNGRVRYTLMDGLNRRQLAAPLEELLEKLSDA